MHLPPTISVLSMFIFLTSMKILLGFVPNSSIFLTASFFIAVATAFLAALFNRLYLPLIYSVGFFVVSLHASFFHCVSFFASQFHLHVFTLIFLCFLHPRTSSQAVRAHFFNISPRITIVVRHHFFNPAFQKLSVGHIS